MLRLDSARNRLLQIELAVSMVTSTAAVGAMIAGIFGMNLNSHIQESEHWFWGVATTLVVGMIVFCAVILIVIWRKGLLAH
jgi:magnesium transporter